MVNPLPYDLSKSRFVSGMQCRKKLYFDKFRKDLKPPLSAAQEALFAQGTRMGELARSVFPNGFDATPMVDFDYAQSAESTRTAIANGESTIYEAAFIADRVVAALDILHHHSNGERWAIEVKSSTNVKMYHTWDAGIQYCVMKKAGFAPDRFFIMVVNNQYTREGDIDVQKLFTMADITNTVMQLQEEVEQALADMKQMMASATEPVVSIGPHCSSPFECDYKHHCWKHVPEYSVFDLSNIGTKAWKIYSEGKIEASDLIHRQDLSDRQLLEAKAALSGSEIIEANEIRAYVAKVKYPILFLDFETMNPPLPMYDGCRPYQKIPFQYSVHRLDAEKSEPVHMEFLANPERDDRRALAEALIRDLGNHGSIMTYNASFERGVIQQLALWFPDLSAALEHLLDRIVDLIIPFKNSWYYHPGMRGSNSIKDVLPALVPEMAESYQRLSVNNGGDASNLFLAMAEGRSIGNPESLRKNLLEYCHLDTFAMVRLWQKLLSV